MSVFPSAIETIVANAFNRPDQKAIVIMGDDGTEEHLTNRDILADISTVAQIARLHGITHQDVVLLLLPLSRPLVTSFLGIMAMGAIPSILSYSLWGTATSSSLKQIQSLVTDYEISAVLTIEPFASQLADVLSGTDCTVIDVQARVNDSFASQKPPTVHIADAEIGYVQFTSGTTGARKGVMLSHRAISACVNSFAAWYQFNAKDVVVNWLPLYHDYGLFAGLVTPLVCNMPAVLLSPQRVVRRPESVLQTLAAYRGTVSFIFNSGYDMLSKRVAYDKVNGLNLSQVRLLLAGGEPNRASSQAMFAQRYAALGIQRSALATGYGLAEAVFAVSTSLGNAEPPIDVIDTESLQALHIARPCTADSANARSIVSAGIPLAGMEVGIVDALGNTLPERYTGELRLRGAFLFSGYYKQPERTQSSLREGWFYTGDTGYLADGHLYICGRKKDLIIVAGKNIHPEEVEHVVAGVPGIFPDRVVAFGLDDDQLGTEKLVVLCGTNEWQEEALVLNLERSIRRQVYQELGVTIGEFCVRPKNWIVKTHNGKMARGANREKYLAECEATNVKFDLSD